MRQHNRTCTVNEQNNSTILIIGIIILLLQFIFHITLGAQTITSPDSIQSELKRQLGRASVLKQLNFPNTVARFYRNNPTPIWLRSEEHSQPTVKAMLLLDCVKQYGLQRKDYHPAILDYSIMHKIINGSTTSAATKVEFELMLTDAMISMINHLHYGAYNPTLTNTSIDNGMANGLIAENFLHNTLDSTNLMEAILTVQPQIEQYKQLQGYMKLIAGQYICDSYETPEEEIRTIAINMERLRWREIKSDNYLHVNIPSFKVTYFDQANKHEFKIIVGKPSTPTPTLVSKISYLETGVGCDNTLGKVAFRFNNTYGIYLHNTPEQQYFNQNKRAISHGCIRVEHADVLASMLVQRDGQLAAKTQLKQAMSTYSREKFFLKTPVPILITYLTITVEDGLLVRHDDLYKLDKILMDRMYKKP